MGNDQTNVVAEINRGLEESYIHYNPNRTDYSINDYELNELKNCSNNIWKDVFIAALGLLIPSLINGFAGIADKFDGSFPTIIFINFLIAGVCFFMGLISLVLWRKQTKSAASIISTIKNKPKYKLPKSM